MNRLVLSLLLVASAAAVGCSSSSTSSPPVIDAFSAPANVTADASGNYVIEATFSAHDTDSTISKVDFRATNLADNPIATDNRASYTDQKITLTLEHAPKGTFAYTFVVTDALGLSASSEQSITLE